LVAGVFATFAAWWTKAFARVSQKDPGKALIVDEPILDDYEKEMVRWCAQKYLDHEDETTLEGFPRFSEVGQERVCAARDRLVNANLIEGIPLRLMGESSCVGVSSREFRVLPACVELVHAWDHPPLPDYRDKLTKWFWSKPWSIVVYIVVIGLPALLGYIVMLQTILEWAGIIKGSSPK
jgi:hypothetical protein